MNRKKITIIIVAFVSLSVLYGIYLIIDNYHFGQKLYAAACDMSIQSAALVRSIDLLERNLDEIDNTDNLICHRYSFDHEIFSLQSHFGCDEVPLRADVRSEWINQFVKLYNDTLSDEDLKNTLHGEEIYTLRDQLENLTNRLVSFQESYNQMPVWRRYFVSWKNERNILSDQVRISGLNTSE